MGADWNAIENALWTWVQGASGLDSAHVLWAHQLDNRPSTGSFVSLLLTGPSRVGVVDEVRSVTDLGQPAGQEIKQTVNARRSFSVSIQVYQAPVSESSSTPATARGVLGQVVTKLALPSVRAALAVAGVSPWNVSEIRNVSTKLDTKFEGRAQVDVDFYTSDGALEQTGYIATVNVNPETFNPP